MEKVTIDTYLANFSGESLEKMNQLRAFIKTEVPQASEKISWSMPTFTLNGNLCHFAGAKNHIGFYPGSETIAHFAPIFEEQSYHYSKGAVQFPLGKELPLPLVKEMLAYGVALSEKR